MKKIVLVLIASLLIMACTTSEKMNIKNEIVKSYYEILDNGNVNRMEELLATNLIDHDGHGGNAVEEIKGLILALKNGFSNSNHNLELVEYLEEDKVFIRWRMTAKHTGEFFGTPATNKNVNFVGHDVLKIKDNKVVEIWHVENLLGMFEQMKAE